MVSWRKRIALGITLVMTLGVLSACGATPTPSSGNAAQGESTLDQVIARGTLRVGVILSLPPFGMRNAAGEPEGYDVALAQEVADGLGVKLEIVDTTAADRIPNLLTNKVDLIIGSFTRNAERAKVIGFTDTYVTALVVVVMVPKDSPIQSVADLAGKKVAAVKGTTQDLAVTAAAPDAIITRYDQSSTMLLALKQGQVDAIVEDSNFLGYQAKLDPSFRVIFDPAFKDLVDYNSWGLRRGDPDWMNWLNIFLFNLNVSGKNLEMYRDAFGQDMPVPLRPQY